MRKNKLGKYMIIGACLGGLMSLSDRHTRDAITRKSKRIISDFTFYSENPTVLKLKLEEKKEKYQSIYEQFSDDAYYIKEKVEELKQLTPQLQELVMDTKDAFTESKDEYKSIVDKEQ